MNDSNRRRNSGKRGNRDNQKNTKNKDAKGNKKSEKKDPNPGCSNENIQSIARCNEEMPLLDEFDNLCQKMNNVKKNEISFDPNSCSVVGSYSKNFNPNTLPFPELLKIHENRFLSGFEFGEATKRQAHINMKASEKTRERQLSEDVSKLPKIDEDENENNNDNLEKGSTVLKSNTKEDEMNKESEIITERAHKTPHSHKRHKLVESKEIELKLNTDLEFSSNTRQIPEALTNHNDCIEVWNYMIYKEEVAVTLRNPRLFIDFKTVTPRMRAILLDWLMEVAEVYHLRRVTYYLSVDYFDRFLSIRPDIPKSMLQLVGITCLYIAAKVEEIYPPNLSEFAYVCDGACKAREMVSCEILILNSLGWEVVVTTPSDWLNLYMQLHHKTDDILRSTLSLSFNSEFIYPQYSAYQFTRASQLMDLLSLDPGFLKFSYSVIAASAMYYMYGRRIATRVSGLTWRQMKGCIKYMSVFFDVLRDAPDPRLRSCVDTSQTEETNRSSGQVSKNKGSRNENYSLQTHVATMQYFEQATIIRLSKLTDNLPKSPAVVDEEVKLDHIDISSPKEETLDLSDDQVCNNDEEDEEDKNSEDSSNKNKSCNLDHNI